MRKWNFNSKPPHLPGKLLFQGKMFFFDQVAPITGDAIYRAELDNGDVIHSIVTNSRARENQLRYFARG